ncbi:protein takeout-like isoform X2 [Daktulosphaira vitifoliae]|nr:protein takeout-like isoform X2 [Daktulosphaira vitifoliae]
MAKGVPSLKLFPYDPMKISLIEINHDNNRAVQVNLKVKDVETINMLSSTEITDFKVDVKNLSASISLFMKGPVLQKGTYYVNGKILALPIVGNGPFSLKIEDINAYIKLYMKKIVKNKKEYLKPENISWNYSNKKLSIKMDNLFNGNKALGDNMNVFMNENWPELGKDFQPALEQVLVSALFEYTSQFFGRVSMEELFIE